MNPGTVLIISTLISIGGVLISAITAAFVAGIKWGKINEEITSIDRRLARIEGMFTLTFKGGDTSLCRGQSLVKVVALVQP